MEPTSPLPSPATFTIPASSDGRNFQSPATKSSPAAPPTTPLSDQVKRQWKQAAQRNLRNQWSKLSSLRKQWMELSSTALSYATAVVNSYLSQRYMDAMDLGVLAEMPDIRKKACRKLFKQQETNRSKLLSSYKDMVAVVTQMVNASKYMRCYLKGASGRPLNEFSCFPGDQNDAGDGDGVPVFTFWSIFDFEKMAEELVLMFVSEMNIKVIFISSAALRRVALFSRGISHFMRTFLSIRISLLKVLSGMQRLLVMEIFSIGAKDFSQGTRLKWSDQFYEGEFDDLQICSSNSNEVLKQLLPRLESCSSLTSLQSSSQLERNVLQVYLTTWLSEVNVNQCRIGELFAMVGEEMHFTIS